ncbi:MAG: tRNA lysidine(34) synthetase TilS [Planctomycetes bacterium]|nr:tRNA lysidine(34) synthetase TilS [Planctomycetota bacterium]
MQVSILQKVIDFTEQQALFSKDAVLMVAVSGGGDSTALLSILVQLRTQDLVKDLVCVHFNHQLRKQALHDQAFVENMAHAWGVPFVRETQNIKDRAQTHRCSIETAGRQWRLERLTALAQAHPCTAIATGHHLDDNAETLIHRLSRGTGFRGLCGIRPVRSHRGVRFISPLLTLTRHEIMAYLGSQQHRWCKDATNQDLTYRRNYLRQALLPELSKQCPALTKQLAHLSQRCHDLYANRVETCANELLKSHVRFSASTAVVTLETLPQTSHVVLAELIRQILTALDVPLRTVTRHHYQTLIALIQGHASQVTLPGNTRAVLDRGAVRFLRKTDAHALRIEPVKLNVPGTTRFGARCFLTRIIDVSQIDTQQRNNLYVETLDLQLVALPLQLRARLPGDRFVPLGKTHSQKVGKFLGRARVKGADRIHTVILCDSEQTILWVCPVRMSEVAKVTNKTKEVLEISVETELLNEAL